MAYLRGIPTRYDTPYTGYASGSLYEQRGRRLKVFGYKLKELPQSVAILVSAVRDALSGIYDILLLCVLNINNIIMATIYV